jgi:hypothetical protein
MQLAIILKMLAGVDQALYVPVDALLFLNLCLHACDGVCVLAMSDKVLPLNNL